MSTENRLDSGGLLYLLRRLKTIFAGIFLSKEEGIAKTEKGAANGVAELDGNGVIKKVQLPDYPSNTRVFYTVCSTPESTAIKNINIINFSSLTNGDTFYIRFQFRTTVNPYLSINGNGKYNIIRNDGQSISYADWQAGEVICLIYSGSSTFRAIGKSHASTTYAGIVRLSSSVNSTSSAEAATSSAVKTAYDLASTKANKDTDAVPGNFAMFDDTGGPVDSGHKHSDYITEHQDISGKADKVASATEGNFASLDSNGNLADSGHNSEEYAPKLNPVFEGYVSLKGRRGTKGDKSIGIGKTVEASGVASAAFGELTIAGGDSSTALGFATNASGHYSVAEGSNSSAGGTNSHAAGKYTTARSRSQFTFGEYNVADPEYTAMGAKGKYIEIVGNGTSTSSRANARALDWNGNEYLSGDVYVGCDTSSANGTKLAKITDIPDISGKIDATEKGSANGVAELDANGKVPSSQLPAYVDDVQEYASVSEFPATGESGIIYVALDTNLTYRWSGSEYVEISQSLALGETASTAYRGDRGASAYAAAVTNVETTPSSGSANLITSGGVYTALDNKADKTDTVLETTLSKGRKANTTVGYGSFAFGQNVTASGAQSHAEGQGTEALGAMSHSEGYLTVASGSSSHSEGYQTVASGSQSHTEGYYTISAGSYCHAGGSYNVPDSYDSWNEWTPNTSYAVGDKVKRTDAGSVIGYVCNTANSDSTFSMQHWTYLNNKMNYSEIIGNGEDGNNRSNARALDWDGNERLMGDVYVGCNADSTGGTKLAKLTDLPEVATTAETQAIIDEYEVSA